MTFPFEHFPSLYRLVSDDYDSRGMLRRTCSVHGDTFVAHRGCPACAFPILRSTPLWQPTWIRVQQTPSLMAIYKARYDGMDQAGYWFPPLSCESRAMPTRRRYWIRLGHHRIFSSPLCRCATCLDNAQAIEIMLVGIARAVSEWGEWEHRCWWRRADERNQYAERHACTCGRRHSLVSWRIWAEAELLEWAIANRRANEPRTVLVPPGTTMTITASDGTSEVLDVAPGEWTILA